MIKLSRASTKHVHMTFVFRWFQKKETFRWHYLVPFPAILILLSGVQDWKGGGLLYARFYLYLSPCSMTQNNACKSGLLQWQFGVEKNTHTQSYLQTHLFNLQFNRKGSWQQQSGDNCKSPLGFKMCRKPLLFIVVHWHCHKLGLPADGEAFYVMLYMSL